MQDAFRLFKNTREYFTPVLTESQFLERGMLTPEEFVRAGDQLVRTCPVWRWEGGDSTKVKPYLPPNKQFLITRGVPCYQRVAALNSAQYFDEKDDVIPDSTSTTEPDSASENVDAFVEIDEKDMKPQVSDLWTKISTMVVHDDEDGAQSMSENNAKVAQKLGEVDNDDDEYADLEEDSLALDAAVSSLPSSAGAAKGQKKSTNRLLRPRRYDVSMTYDNYYRTPKIWLFGYDENGSILSPEDIFEDVIQDYAKRTVTIDPHPHLSHQHASIHPCQHAAAMLTILRALESQSSNAIPNVDQYLFIFLKFIQSVVPTIEYDYTVDVQTRAINNDSDTK